MQRWYYVNNPPVSRPLLSGFFFGSIVPYDQQFFSSNYINDDNTTTLYYGHASIRKSKKNDDILGSYIVLSESSNDDSTSDGDIKSRKMLRNKINEMIKPSYSDASYLVLSEAYYDILSCWNYSSSDSILETDTAEIGLFDDALNDYVKKDVHVIKLGEVVALRVKEDYKNASKCIDHYMVLQADLKGLYSLYSHTWSKCVSSKMANATHLVVERDSIIGVDVDIAGNAISHTIEDRAPLAIDIDYSAAETDKVETEMPIKVLTYNIWHNNPPSYIYHDDSDRWKRYDARLKHLVSIIAAEDPDIILLQEVRVDSSFRNRKITPFNYDNGSQFEHILKYLNNEKIRYQSLYHPMMTLNSKEQPSRYRNEEGLSILSKHAIIDCNIHLLPRNFSDNSDDHQRGFMHTRIQIHNKEDANDDEDVIVDAFNTHLSLSPTARDASAIAMRNISDTYYADYHRAQESSSSRRKRRYIQVVAGDFNAEPGESSINILEQDALLPVCSHTNDVTSDSSSNFADAWKEKHRDDVGYSFPTCNPVKRIDFIFIRNVTGITDINVCNSQYDIVNSYLIGGAPTDETMHLIGSSSKGMLDADSPIWASDHFGLVATIKVK